MYKFEWLDVLPILTDLCNVFFTAKYSNVDGITGFSEEESQSIFSFMKMAIELAKSGDGSIVNAAVIVDPSVKQIITSGYDQLYSWHAPLKKTCVCQGCHEQPAGGVSCADCNGVSSWRTLLSHGSHNESEFSCIHVSCLNPWQWPELQLEKSTSGYWHPLRHAAIVAIEASADRDRRLFPVSGNKGEKFYEAENTQTSSVGSPAKRQKTDLANVEVGKELDANTEGSHSFVVCNGACPSKNQAYILCFPQSKCRRIGQFSQTIGREKLNHHYAVFRVVLPEEDEYRIRLARGTSNCYNSDLVSKNGYGSLKEN